jgi:hypothetical protein
MGAPKGANGDEIGWLLIKAGQRNIIPTKNRQPEIANGSSSRYSKHTTL